VEDQISKNLELYNKVRSVPESAQKPITGGRLKGKTDINPMWRIKVLTEMFGMCGIGWKTEIIKQWTESHSNGEVAAFVNINLYVKVNGEWSEPIPGTGGSMFVANEKTGLHISDECYKMAYTDAVSVACKALGVGADIYWDKDTTKYDSDGKREDPARDKDCRSQKDAGHKKDAGCETKEDKRVEANEIISEAQARRMYALSGSDKTLCTFVLNCYGYNTSKDVEKKDYNEMCDKISELAAAKGGR